MLNRLKEWARTLRIELYALYLAYRDPRVHWYERLMAACVVGYAFSPIDLIPDPIPIIGYLDDLIIVRVGIWLGLKMIPKSIMAECREKARNAMEPSASKRSRYLVAAVVVAVWCLVLAFVVLLALRITHS